METRFLSGQQLITVGFAPGVILMVITNCCLNTKQGASMKPTATQPILDGTMLCLEMDCVDLRKVNRETLKRIAFRAKSICDQKWWFWEENDDA